MTQKLIWRYGCVRCQIHHHEGDALYDAHHRYHDKHGSNRVPVSHALVGKLPVTFDNKGKLVWQEQPE